MRVDPRNRGSLTVLANRLECLASSSLIEKKQQAQENYNRIDCSNEARIRDRNGVKQLHVSSTGLDQPRILF